MDTSNGCGGHESCLFFCNDWFVMFYPCLSGPVEFIICKVMPISSETTFAPPQGEYCTCIPQVRYFSAMCGVKRFQPLFEKRSDSLRVPLHHAQLNAASPIGTVIIANQAAPPRLGLWCVYCIARVISHMLKIYKSTTAHMNCAYIPDAPWTSSSASTALWPR